MGTPNEPSKQTPGTQDGPDRQPAQPELRPVGEIFWKWLLPTVGVLFGALLASFPIALCLWPLAVGMGLKYPYTVATRWTFIALSLIILLMSARELYQIRRWSKRIGVPYRLMWEGVNYNIEGEPMFKDWSRTEIEDWIWQQRAKLSLGMK